MKKLIWGTAALAALAVTVVLASILWVAAPTAYPVQDVRALLFASMVVLALLPLVLIAANALLAPYEQHTRNSYEHEAVARIKARLRR